MTNLIGIYGRMGSGKDTFYDFMADLAPFGRFQNKKFANTLKEQVAANFGIDPKRFEDQAFKSSICDQKTGKTWRDVLIDVGTHERSKDPDVFVKKAFEHFDSEATEPIWVFTDVRFKNEAINIKLNGGILVKLERQTDGYYKPEDKEMEGLLDDEDHLFDVIYSCWNLVDLRMCARDTYRRFILEQAINPTKHLI